MNMYAVIESGGKQHRVIEGEVLNVELLEAAAGDKIDFNEVLMVGNGADVKVGAPFVAGGKVSAEVVGHGRADKIRVIKFRRRKHFRKQMGHRQWFTQIKITAISA
jgi:large subunit ribosomal protein L21